MAEAGSFEEVSDFLERGGGDIDLVLLDLSMPGVRGFSGLMYLRAQYPSLPIVVVSANDDPAVIRRCMEFGASGFIPKTLGIEALRAAVARVLQGEVFTPPDVDLTRPTDAETTATIAKLATLTPQQVRVLMMLSAGLLNKQIAYELGVSEATVKAHVSAILQKLGVESRTQAVIAAGKIEAGSWPQVSAERNVTLVIPGRPKGRPESSHRCGKTFSEPCSARLEVMNSGLLASLGPGMTVGAGHRSGRKEIHLADLRAANDFFRIGRGCEADRTIRAGAAPGKRRTMPAPACSACCNRHAAGLSACVPDLRHWPGVHAPSR